MSDEKDRRIALLEATLARIASGLSDEDDIHVNRDWIRAQVSSVLPHWRSKVRLEPALSLVK